jgi:hypothetical protein
MANKFDKAHSKAADALAEITGIGKLTKQFLDIPAKDLMPFDQNDEDVLNTAELEEGMEKVGFIGRILVTDLNIYPGQNGRYVIIAGHRRVEAAKKSGIDPIPSEVVVDGLRDYADVHLLNYLMGNERSSDDDPLREFRHFQKGIKAFTGKGEKLTAAELGKMMGKSVPTVSRYKAMAKTIAPIVELVGAGRLGMSSIQPIAKFSEEKQNEIFEALKKLIADGQELTRDYIAAICRSYEKGGAEEAAQTEKPKPVAHGARDVESVKTDAVITDPAGGGLSNGGYSGQNTPLPGQTTIEDVIGGEPGGERASGPTVREIPEYKPEKEEITEAEQAVKDGRNVLRHVEEIDKLFGGVVDFPDNEVENAFAVIQGLYLEIPEELREIAKSHKKAGAYNEFVDELNKRVKQLVGMKLQLM